MIWKYLPNSISLSSRLKPEPECTIIPKEVCTVKHVRHQTFLLLNPKPNTNLSCSSLKCVAGIKNCDVLETNFPGSKVGLSPSSISVVSTGGTAFTWKSKQFLKTRWTQVDPEIVTDMQPEARTTTEAPLPSYNDEDINNDLPGYASGDDDLPGYNEDDLSSYNTELPPPLPFPDPAFEITTEGSVISW